GLDQEPRDAIYLPIVEYPSTNSTIFIRVLGDPAAATEQLRAAARATDPDNAVSEVRTLEDIRGEALSTPKLTTTLLGLFAGLPLLTTIAGLSGLIAYSVSRRTHEIGIRMALGADRGRIVTMVLREGMASVVAGLGIGIAGALALSRLVSGLLFEIGPTDP